MRFDVVKDFPGLQAAEKGKGFLRLRSLGRTADRPLYSFACNFWGKDKSYVIPRTTSRSSPRKSPYNPANGRLALAADTLDAPIPAGAKPWPAATYKVTLGDKEIAAGKLRYFVNQWYDDLVELGELQPGKYEVALALVDDAGKELATAKGGFEKKDEAKEFAKWWNNKIGDPEKLLQPFEALRVGEGRGRGSNGAARGARGEWQGQVRGARDHDRLHAAGV